MPSIWTRIFSFSNSTALPRYVVLGADVFHFLDLGLGFSRERDSDVFYFDLGEGFEGDPTADGFASGV